MGVMNFKKTMKKLFDHFRKKSDETTNEAAQHTEAAHKDGPKKLVVVTKQNGNDAVLIKEGDKKAHNHDADMKALLEVVAPGEFWSQDAKIGFTNTEQLLEQFLDAKTLGMLNQFSDGFEFGG